MADLTVPATPKDHGTLGEQKEGGCGGRREHRPSGSRGGLYHVPGVGSPCCDLGPRKPRLTSSVIWPPKVTHVPGRRHTGSSQRASRGAQASPSAHSSGCRVWRQPQATTPLRSAVSTSWPSGQGFLLGPPTRGTASAWRGSWLQLYEPPAGAHADVAPILVTCLTEQDEGRLPEITQRLTAVPPLLLAGYAWVHAEGCGGTTLCVPWRWRAELTSGPKSTCPL